MRIIEVNKANWSGETIKVRIKADNSFELYDYNFQLAFRRYGTHESFKVTEEGWDYPLVKGIRYAGEEEWVAYQEVETMEEMSREAKDPFEAAVQVLSNII
jgi:hypothetical protein